MKILVFGQIRDNAIEENVLGILNKLSEVFADSEISLALLANQINNDWVEELGKHGAKKVYTVEASELENYLSYPYVKSMLEIIEKTEPSLVLAAGTVFGEDLIPRLAVHHGISCAQRIVDISLDIDNILFHTPVRDDQAMRVTKLVGAIKFATTRTGAFFINENPSGKSPEVEKVEVTFEAEDMLVKHIEIKKAERTVNLKDAKLIVAGGRGVGGKDNFQILKDLATLLNGEIGATRACTDLHWIEETYEIGQTGQSVSPDIYIAAGISGAPQHLSGVKAKTLISINKDEGAPIFNYSDYGIVGDLHEILPILKKKLE
ncbi:MAG: electron transfer flavoprotein subunit alpha/FixB family protein [Candidatus Heimdallarchaeota archaeon]|nr:electron transfer flavoprotein subunit alpha/FixB family protein [Candidatus Heimdallarchaeota archaeon]